MKQAATIKLAQSKRRTLQSIIYPPEKTFIGTSSIFARGKSRVLPTDPLFTLLFHSRAKIGSLSNDDDDDGENVSLKVN